MGTRMLAQRGNVISVAAMAALVLSACASEQRFDGPWAEELESAYGDAATDFQRKVLEDGTITAEEYAEATERLERCMDDRGFGVSIRQIDGLNNYTLRATPGAETAFDECSDEIAPIESLYGAMRVNPDNRDPWEVKAECLVRHGFAEIGFDGDALKEVMMSDNTVLPSGRSFEEDEVRGCLVNPHL